MLLVVLLDLFVGTMHSIDLSNSGGETSTRSNRTQPFVTPSLAHAEASEEQIIAHQAQQDLVLGRDRASREPRNTNSKLPNGDCITPKRTCSLVHSSVSYSTGALIGLGFG